MPRMRTASKAYRLILEQDPDSEITLHYIRHLIASGAVPVIHVGRKKLVDVDQLLAYRKGAVWRHLIVSKTVLASSNKVTDLAGSGIAVRLLSAAQ